MNPQTRRVTIRSLPGGLSERFGPKARPSASDTPDYPCIGPREVLDSPDYPGIGRAHSVKRRHRWLM